MTKTIKAALEHGSTLTSLKLALVGHLSHKTDGVDLKFPHYAIAIVSRGRGSFQSGSERPVAVEAPFMFYVHPDLHYTYGPSEGESWEEQYIVFGGSRVEEWVQSGWIPPHPGPYKLPDFKTHCRAHERILELLLRERAVDTDRAKLEAERFVFNLYWDRERLPGRNRGIAARLQAWQSDPGFDWDMQQEAQLCGLSYSRFRERFREHYNHPPHQILLELRIEYASRQLIETDKTIKQIAAETGFNSLEGFYKAFRKKMDCPPAEYREMISAWNRPSGS